VCVCVERRPYRSAKRKPHTVLFGKVEGENRGPNPMDPCVERNDDLFWLRDDDRKVGS
jgi:oligopeptidase B